MDASAAASTPCAERCASSGPAALAAFAELGHPDGLAVLRLAPEPEPGRRLSTSQIVAALRRGGRQRNIERRAAQLDPPLTTVRMPNCRIGAAAVALLVEAIEGQGRRRDVMIEGAPTRILVRRSTARPRVT